MICTPWRFSARIRWRRVIASMPKPTPLRISTIVTGDAEAGEVLGGLAAGGAAADDDHALARRRPQLVAQEALRVVHDRRADAGDRRDQRLGAGGDQRRRPGAAAATTLGRDVGVEVDLDAELGQPRAPGSRGSAAPRACSAPARRPRACRRAASSRSQIETSWPRSRAIRAASMPAGPLPTTITRRGARPARHRPGELAPGLGVDRAARDLAAADEVDARVAGDARPQLVEPPVLRPCAASPARRSACGRAGPGRRRRSRSRRRRSAGSSSRPTAITGTSTAALTAAA